MKRLLWKELREKWIWFLALAASVIGPILYGDRYFFLGDAHSLWIILPSLVALGLGASAYSSELAGGTADFVRSRPVSWKKTLAAKIIVGAVYLLAAAILAAGVYRLTCPEQYIPFADPVSLVIGAGIAALFMGLGYLSGFVCSAVLPGMFGGLLVMFLVLISYALEFMVYSLLKIEFPRSQWSFYFRFIGAAVATVLIARFGTTLPVTRRIMKFSAIVGIFVLIGIPLGFVVKSDPFRDGTMHRVYYLSDNGKYAVMGEWSYGSGKLHYYLVRVADGKKSRIPVSVENNTVALHNCWYNGTLAAVTNNRLWMGRMDASGRLRHVDVPIGRPHGQTSWLTPSPNGRLIMFEVSSGKDLNAYRLAFADLETLRPLSVTLNGVWYYWWQSDTEVGYTIGKSPQRHILRVIK